MFKAISEKGICINLYNLLWMKDKVTDQHIKLNVPDTIIFKYGLPAFWFFTGKSEFYLKKSPEYLTTDAIKTHFLRKYSKSGIVAVFIYVKKQDDMLHRIIRKNMGHEDEFKPKTVNSNCFSREGLKIDEFTCPAPKGNEVFFEYFDEQTFIKFIDSDTKPYDGILQKFIDPRDERNAVFKVIWSPKLCIMEKRINNKELFNTKYDIYERALTYEGDLIYSTELSVRSTTLMQKIKEACNSIAQHISNISYDTAKISRIVCFLKQDIDENVWFLWANSISFYEENIMKNKGHLRFSSNVKQKAREERIIMRAPHNVRDGHSVFTSRPINLRKTEKCLNCNEYIEPERLHDIECKRIISDSKKATEDYITPNPVIIKLINFRNLHPAGGPRVKTTSRKLRENSNINIQDRVRIPDVPQILTKIDPQIDLGRLKKQEINPLFNNQKIRVCENCYLTLCSSTKASGINKILIRKNEYEKISEIDEKKLNFRNGQYKGHAKDVKYARKFLLNIKLENQVASNIHQSIIRSSSSRAIPEKIIKPIRKNSYMRIHEILFNEQDSSLT